MRRPLPLDWAPPIAAQQDALFTTRQALDAGATRDEVRWRRERGHWVRYAGDAFTLPGTIRHPRVDAVAAALTWPDAVLCLASAARFQRLAVPDDGLIHVVVPTKRDARARLQPHQFRIPSREIVRVGLVRMTSRRQTVLDCLGRLDERAADELFAWAMTRDLLRADDVQHYLAARPHAWGNARRRRALDDLADGAASVAEQRLHGILRSAGLTGWESDQRLFDDDGALVARVDILFHRERLVVEVDGFAHHSGRARFQADRQRQNRIMAAGWRVLRFTWQDLVERPTHVVGEIRAVLGRHPAT